MKKGIFVKWSMGVALAAAVSIFSAPAFADLDGATLDTEPTAALVMPFDNSGNKVSFQFVSRIGAGPDAIPGPIATHWSYWAKDCRHLADVFICLTPNDSIVVDPTLLQGEIQSPNPPQNNKTGPVINLTGEKGVVIITAFEADTGASGLDCRIIDETATLEQQIAGFWTIANTSTNAAFGNDAIGLVIAEELPDPGRLVDGGGIRLQTFNPQSLGDSEVIVISLEEAAGNAQFIDTEVGPIQRDRPDGHHVCCNVNFTDNLEVTISLPDFCLECVGFAPISDNVAEDDDPASVIPPTTTVERPGFVTLVNCQVGGEEGGTVPLGDEFNQALFAFHGQAVGPFGVVVSGKFTGESF